MALIGASRYEQVVGAVLDRLVKITFVKPKQ